MVGIATARPFINNPATLEPPKPKEPDPTLVLAEGTLKVEAAKLELEVAKFKHQTKLDEATLELKDKDMELDYDVAKEKNRLNAVKG